MRYLVIRLIFFVSFCFGCKQKTFDNNSKIDTAKLFDPNPQEGKKIETQEVLCNSLMLEDENIAASIGCQKIELHNVKELQALLQNNNEAICENKFYIVYANNTSNKRIIDIIDIVKAAKINDYKVINLQSLFKLNMPQ